MKKLLFLLLVSAFALNSNAQKIQEAKDAKKLAKEQAKAAKVQAKGAKVENIQVAPVSKDASLYVASDVVDYGIIERNSDGVRKFNISNRGGQPLIISNCSGSCGCTVPTCPREPILPGKSAEISIKYATDRVGTINKQVNITTNDPVTPNKVIMVKGEVKDGPAAQ